MVDIDLQVEQIAQSYNALPYDSHAFKWCAPAYIRAAAYLYGVDLPPVATARVLEIGCAAGGNSLPFAFMYPKAEIIGFDVAQEQIKQGQQIIERAGLKNITLHTRCLTQLPNSWGQFDYVIAHGVLSWIPQDLHAHLFKCIASALHEQAGAYLSFNTYPGWKAQETVRDLMLWHSRKVNESKEKVTKAREALSFLKKGISTKNLLRPIKHHLATQLPSCSSHDYYLAHEYLELHNHPMYFTDMYAYAQAENLKYIGDAEPQIESLARYDLAKNNDFLALQRSSPCRISQQQYLDFAVGRSFRKSLLCSVKNRQHAFSLPDFSRLKDLLFAGSFEPTSAHTHGTLKTYIVFDEVVKVSCVHIQKMLATLHCSWPKPVSGHDLLRVLELNNKKYAEQLLKQLFFLFPLELCRSYEDLPECLQDDYRGLIPGAAVMMSTRFTGISDINEFNAWHSSSTEKLTATDIFIIQHLEQNRSPLLTASALECAWEARMLAIDNNESLENTQVEKSHLAESYVTEVIDRLHKYAIYI